MRRQALYTSRCTVQCSHERRESPCRYPPVPQHPPIAFYSAVRLGDPEQLAKIMDTDPYFVTQDNGAGAPIHFATTYKQLDMVRLRRAGEAAGSSGQSAAAPTASPESCWIDAMHCHTNLSMQMHRTSLPQTLRPPAYYPTATANPPAHPPTRPPSHPPAHPPARLGCLQIHHLLNTGAEVNQRDDKGFTPLHRAAYLAHYDGYLEIYEYLLVGAGWCWWVLVGAGGCWWVGGCRGGGRTWLRWR